jgi:hypothetical protein
MKRELLNHGLIVDPIQEQDYLFGQLKLPAVILQSDRDWSPYLPSDEYQNKYGLETYNCTNYGTLNCIEILMDRNFGIEANYSERYTGVETGTVVGGNSIQKVIETIRKVCGLIPENMLPFDSFVRTWEQYYSPKPMSEDLEKIGQEWLKKYALGHEWIFTLGDGKDRISRMKECLQYSPIGITVCAWIYDDNGFCINPDKETDNHWVVCYGYEDGQYWKIFDSYDNTRKKLDWNYPFGYGKRFTLDKIMTEEEKIPLMQKTIEVLKKLIILYQQLLEKTKVGFRNLFNKK